MKRATIAQEEHKCGECKNGKPDNRFLDAKGNTILLRCKYKRFLVLKSGESCEEYTKLQ